MPAVKITMTVLLAIASIIWGASEAMAFMRAEDAQQNQQLVSHSNELACQAEKDSLLDAMLIELRTRMVLAEARLDEHDQRFDREVEELGDQIDDIAVQINQIHQVLMGGR